MNVVLQLPFTSSFLVRDPRHLCALGMARSKTDNGGVGVASLGREGESKRERELVKWCVCNYLKCVCVFIEKSKIIVHRIHALDIHETNKIIKSLYPLVPKGPNRP
ncbi:hypothetical protein HanXRQr2_Chr07g0292221 [Helianthus annuus]|uniref:Uncharacterized protein n=1 Tax=Helianthus annuus TaxID=4232 RepID=A0A9K3NFG6_HELAN|nr:hypothetical protein HanXRQr2_Chr07g0292221 [Helianthus annuus]KAJ0904501.1 hypothetical protein HanPSC8_Chr07g0282981 [Helianthus annuus]